MSWSISEILKPFKNLQECIIKSKNSRLRLQFSNLIIHSCLFPKQYVKLLLTTILKKAGQMRLLNTPMYVNFNFPLFKIYHLTIKIVIIITCKIINEYCVIWQRFSPWFSAHEKRKPIVNLTYFLNHNIKLPSFKPCQKTKIALAIADPGLTQRVHYSKLQVIHLSMLLDTSLVQTQAPKSV